MTYEVLKKDFHDPLFPMEKREAEDLEFINLHQVCMSVHEYYLKFNIKICSFLFSHTTDEMSNFVTGVSNDLQEECHSDMLNDNMKISHPMLHIIFVYEIRTKSKSRDDKRERSFG